ncbi:MAG TPA: right-handed parallel beta-helix repeat-containing protein, partial [Hellea balneolensis]|nr:right-handed parallel beta-helix repeat-containing protein [Hellea balneolensis]
MVESNIVRLTHNGVSGFDYHGIIQGHLDLGKIVILESGTTWEISQPLWLRRGSGLKAEGVADRYPVTTEVAPAGYPINATVIKLVTISGAPALTNSAVIMISPLNIGVASSNIDPNDSSKYLAPATSDNVFAASLEGLVIDGNNIADYGVYAYRAHDMSIENCVFTHTQKHAVYVTACYSGYISHCLAFDNDGCGFTFGFGDLDFPNLPKWPVTGAQLNGFVVDDIHAVACGLARTFDDGIISTNPPKWRDGCGIALRPHRGNVFTKLTSENNDGANLYLEPTGQSNIINGYYSELANSHFVPAGPGGQPPKIKSAIEDERAAVLWDIVVNLDSENDNVFRAFGNRFENALCGGGWIRILGDIPPVPGRQGQAMCFANFSGGLGTYADNDLYYFENSEPKYTTEFLPHTSISSEDAKAPNGIRGSYNGNVLADAGVVAHANFK